MKKTLDKIAQAIETQEGGSAHPRMETLKEVLVALSLAHMGFINSWFTTLFDADCGYYNYLPVNRVTLLAVLLTILVAAFLIWGLLRLRHRLQKGPWFLLIGLAAVIPVFMPVNFVRTSIFHFSDYQVYLFIKRPLVLLTIFFVASLALWKHRWTGRGVAMLAGILSPLALFTVGKILLLLFGAIHLKQHTGAILLPPPVAVQAGQTRVLWLIFDETDQRLALEEVPDGMTLPAFHRLQTESIAASRAYPPSDSTLISMPGLISGRQVSDAAPISASDMKLEMVDTKWKTTWKELPSVFSDARALGYNTAVLGWYHPYGRVLGSNLNFCVWYPFPLFEPIRSDSFWRAVRRQLSCFIWTWHVRSDYVHLLHSCREQAVTLATNTTYGLTLMHLPPPHTPGVYLPDTKTYTTLGMSKKQGYLNNLVLADEWLAEIRAAMEAAGVWDNTWIILSADHSWRDSSLYDGKRDLRVPYLIKPPHQPAGAGITFTNQFNTVLTKALILSVFHGDVTNAQSVTEWIQKHGSPVMPAGKAGKYNH